MCVLVFFFLFYFILYQLTIRYILFFERETNDDMIKDEGERERERAARTHDFSFHPYNRTSALNDAVAICVRFFGYLVILSLLNKINICNWYRRVVFSLLVVQQQQNKPKERESERVRLNFSL